MKHKVAKLISVKTNLETLKQKQNAEIKNKKKHCKMDKTNRERQI